MPVTVWMSWETLAQQFYEATQNEADIKEMWQGTVSGNESKMKIDFGWKCDYKIQRSPLVHVHEKHSSVTLNYGLNLNIWGESKLNPFKVHNEFDCLIDIAIYKMNTDKPEIHANVDLKVKHQKNWHGLILDDIKEMISNRIKSMIFGKNKKELDINGKLKNLKDGMTTFFSLIDKNDYYDWSNESMGDMKISDNIWYWNSFETKCDINPITIEPLTDNQHQKNGFQIVLTKISIEQIVKEYFDKRMKKSIESQFATEIKKKEKDITKWPEANMTCIEWNGNEIEFSVYIYAQVDVAGLKDLKNNISMRFKPCFECDNKNRKVKFCLQCTNIKVESNICMTDGAKVLRAAIPVVGWIEAGVESVFINDTVKEMVKSVFDEACEAVQNIKNEYPVSEDIPIPLIPKQMICNQDGITIV